MIYNLMEMDLVCTTLLSLANEASCKATLSGFVDCLDRVRAYSSSKGSLPEALDNFLKENRDRVEELSPFGLQLFRSVRCRADAEMQMQMQMQSRAEICPDQSPAP